MTLSPGNQQFFNEIVWIDGTVAGNVVMTRPADVTPYAAGDEMSNNVAAGSAAPWVFASVVPQNGRAFSVHRMILETNSQVALGTPTVRLYSEAPAMSGDNAAFAGTEAAYDDMETVFSFVAQTSVAGGQWVGTFESTTPRIVLCEGNAATVYAVLVCPGAYVPASGQTFKLKMMICR